MFDTFGKKGIRYCGFFKIELDKVNIDSVVKGNLGSTWVGSFLKIVRVNF